MGCTSLERLRIHIANLLVSYDSLTSLNLSNNTALELVYCYGQKLSGKSITPTYDSSFPYKFSFSSLIPSSLTSRILSDSVHGYASDGSTITTTYSDGTAYFASLPAEIDYEFSTGWGDTTLPVNPALRVNLTINSTGDSSSSTTSPSIITSSLNTATAGLSYTATLRASGTKPITWSLIDGALPSGLELFSSGTLSGVTTETGSYTFTVQAANSSGAELTTGTVGVDYGFTLRASGVRPLSWAIVSGDIPGLTLDDSGLLTGTPTTEGTFSFTVQAQNIMGLTSRDLSITINPAPLNMRPTITTTELEPGTVDTEYIFQFTASGTPPMTWEILKGKLPKDLELSSSGKLSGVLNKAGKKTFTNKIP